MFIQTEATPNPATLKFLPGEAVLTGSPVDFRKGGDFSSSPLAQRLFEISGIDGVFLGADFITVTKNDSDWQNLKPAVMGAIMEHYMSGAPVFEGAGAEGSAGSEAQEDFDEADSEIVATIKDLLDTRVRPAVAQDGGDITFHGFKEGIVYLQMKGACAGCPSSTATLKHGVENLLKHFIPEIKEVQAV